ncbi:hypothetical protein TNCV_727891 [Trichonephila clavipes]|nr:hypothetical protein TNCV_727891 [Trichonephila clavipes]
MKDPAILKVHVWIETLLNSNSVTQQLMRARIYCAHPSIRDHSDICSRKQMSQSGGHSEAGPQCLSPQESLVLIYRHNVVGMKAESTLPSLGIETGPVVWKRNTLPLDHWALETLLSYPQKNPLFFRCVTRKRHNR